MMRRRFCHTRGLTRVQSAQLLIGKNSSSWFWCWDRPRKTSCLSIYLNIVYDFVHISIGIFSLRTSKINIVITLSLRNGPRDGNYVGDDVVVMMMWWC